MLLDAQYADSKWVGGDIRAKEAIRSYVGNERKTGVRDCIVREGVCLTCEMH
jgi:hypothetical protein